MDKSDVVYDGSIGIYKKVLGGFTLSDIKRELTLTPSSYVDDNPAPVIMWSEDDDYIWIPRHYPDTCLTKLPPIDYDFPDDNNILKEPLVTKTTLRSDRNQPEAVKKIIDRLIEDKGTVLQAYTGAGKTIMGFHIASHFCCNIGVFVYNNHMMKNWVDTAKLVFGLDESDIGVVQGDRCDLGKPVTVMMVQSLYGRDYDAELYDQMGFLLADEVNRFGAPVWQSVISMFKATYRLGMSADPKRKDGLSDIIKWNFGNVGFRMNDRKKKALPLVVQVSINRTYNRKKYLSHYGHRRGEPDAMKYRKLVCGDSKRDDVMVSEMVKARRSGRKALVFTQFRDHVIRLRESFDELYNDKYNKQGTRTSLLMGGIKNKDLDDAMTADFIFTTYAFSRDALNLPHIDTVFFCSPCGDPLQAIGRLRDTGDKKSLLGVDFYELNDYSQSRAKKRREVYRDLKMEVRNVKRNVKR